LQREIGRALASGGRRLYLEGGASLAPINWETRMSWKTPKIVEVQVGMEINMYVCATRK
jgi:coenzyme PQQ precursor peptide PqqA